MFFNLLQLLQKLVIDWLFFDCLDDQGHRLVVVQHEQLRCERAELLQREVSLAGWAGLRNLNASPASDVL